MEYSRTQRTSYCISPSAVILSWDLLLASSSTTSMTSNSHTGVPRSSGLFWNHGNALFTCDRGAGSELVDTAVLLRLLNKIPDKMLPPRRADQVEHQCQFRSLNRSSDHCGILMPHWLSMKRLRSKWWVEPRKILASRHATTWLS